MFHINGFVLCYQLTLGHSQLYAFQQFVGALAMTVTYIHDVQTAKRGTFARLLMRWKGGILDGIWMKLLIYLGLYGTISAIYRLSPIHEQVPNGNQFKNAFEKFCVFTSKFGDYIPLSFILGFYVSQVVSRWWTQVMAIPWLDSLCMDLATYMPGEKAKKKKKTDHQVGHAGKHSHT